MISASTYTEAATAAVCTAGAVMTYAVRGRSSTLLAPSIYHGVRTRPAIALTFDDGPSESTPQLLEILGQYNTPSTFFQIGVNVRRLPAVAREVVRAGHEAGNHTDTHPMLCFKSRSFIAGELAAAQDAIEKATGAAPRFFRAPYGVRWFGLRGAQQSLNLMGVMWTTIGVDWKLPVDRVVTRLSRGARNGAVLCLHDGRTVETRPNIRVTLEAVKEIVPRLIDQGFHFETLSRILCPTKN